MIYRLLVLYSLKSWHSCLSCGQIRPMIVKYSGGRTWAVVGTIEKSSPTEDVALSFLFTDCDTHGTMTTCTSRRHRRRSPSSFFFVVAVSSLCRGRETENTWTLSQNKLASTFTTEYQNIIRKRVVYIIDNSALTCHIFVW